MEASGSIYKNGVIALALRFTHGKTGNIHRILLRAGPKNRHTDLIAEHLQLLNGCRPIHIGRDKKRLAALFLELPGKFCRGRGFTRALQTGHHDGYRLPAVKT